MNAPEIRGSIFNVNDAPELPPISMLNNYNSNNSGGVDKNEDFKAFMKRKQTILQNVDMLLEIKFPKDL